MTQAIGIRLAAPVSQRPVAIWLLACAAMVFVMIVLGGLTRLTDSGLSMMEWRPLSVLPPMNEQEWLAWFEVYKQIPQYENVNKGMTLQEFKGIFWLEYIHRLWGRLIGFVFFLPFLYFLFRGHIDRSLAPKLAGIFVLGGLQGALGWFMVASGFTEDVAVSQYRLAAHLMAAILIYGAILWVAFGLLSPRPQPVAADPVRLGRWLRWLLGFASVTIVSGAFVAGLDAGLIYNTFPFMGDGLLPPDLLAETPWWLNFFENMATVQFTHRLLAVSLFALIVAVWLASRRMRLDPRARGAVLTVAVAATLQVALGITTLLLVVPVGFAAAHQAGAVLLVTALIWAIYALPPGRSAD